MTTKKDNYQERVDKLGDAQEQSLGVPLEGFQDPTGEYPKRDYHFDASINKSARGTKVNELYIGGGDFGVNLDLQPQRASEYPFNDVNETQSGHVVEYDDTPGGERILIKHRKGAGVEMRADGSVVISALNNKVEVTGGDQTVIVEGHGNMVYNGNLNLKVSGDFNVDVGGNYNLNVNGNHFEKTQLNHRTETSGNYEYTTKGNRSLRTVGFSNDVILGSAHQTVGVDKETIVEGNIDVSSGDTIFTTAEEKYAVTSLTTNITGSNQLSIFGNKGMIGGKEMNFSGSVYMGNNGPAPFTSNASFYGSFHGQATEAMFSRTAWTAQKSKYAEQADLTHSQSYGEALTSGSKHNEKGGAPEITWNQEVLSPIGAPPVPPLIGAYASSGTYAIRAVTVDEDDELKLRILRSDDFGGVFEKTPTTQQARSAMRSNPQINARLFMEGIISSSYSNPVPPAVGRTSGRKVKAKFGKTPIGNSIENRGKRFTP